ncbi:MAG: hypothetical protein O3C10_09670 [Chloroflexi bacterium]|nr:hypothetical protein [Chloroflexota bacterium]
MKDFLVAWLEDGHFPATAEGLLALTDTDVLVAMNAAAKDDTAAGHDSAARIMKGHRGHFRLVYSRDPGDIEVNSAPGSVIAGALTDRYGVDRVKSDHYVARNAVLDFPVLLQSGDVVSARSMSQILQTLPDVFVDYVFVDPDVADDARLYLKKHKVSILESASAKIESDEDNEDVNA